MDVDAYTFRRMSQVHPVQAVVKAACKAADITKAELCLQLGIGTTTLWRACTGKAIEPEQAKRLRERFPELSYEALTLGTPAVDADPSAEPEPDTEGTNPRAKAPTADTALDADAVAEPKVSAQ